MRINILGYNIFSKGGTSRSNINLIKTFLEKGHIVQYFNSQPFEASDITRLIIHEDISSANFTIFSSQFETKLSTGDVLIITREDLFKYSRIIKQHNKQIKIVGEIHGPLEYINDEIDLALDSIDCIRVSTESIKQKFKQKYQYDAVFNKYVNAQHINLNEKPTNTKRNLLIKSRFEDGIKDISYVIKLINYIKKNTDKTDIQLYIVGYGPSENLYKNLVAYYNLQDNVHINEKEPLNYIYVSTSPYETLGYSILETIGIGNQALIYAGNDNVLNEIYEQYHGVSFLTKHFEKDSEKLISVLEGKYTREQRMEDIQNLKINFTNDNYADDYLKKISKMKIKKGKERKLPSYRFKKTHINKIQNLDHKRDLYEQLKKTTMFKLLLNNNIFFNRMKKMYTFRKERLERKIMDGIEPDENKVFIESFHGNNFSGDPKFLALKIKELYKHKKVYVSSVNSLVDIEVRNAGLIPIRFGSTIYKKIFRSCKYIFMNGNSLDKVFKHKDQIFIQTWHGFPLKKMVNDLADKKEKQAQLNKFLPRMKKWDYLITASNLNTLLLKSAFKLEKNHNLTVLELGSPRNEYLINNNNEEEWLRVQRKYLFTNDKNMKYILYCPTWRQGERESLTQIDLITLLNQLPKNYKIIVKLHPNEARLRNKYNGLDARIHCFYNEFVDIQELYILCESMITDYSSTIFDYAHLNKPIFLLQEDDSQYKKDVGFYFDINEVGRFPEAALNEAKLAGQLTRVGTIDYSQMINRLMKNDKSNTSENILKCIFENTKENVSKSS
ncbi:CDP-glycerol glycerophosphotransferase family protein [Staphylococcus sp. ACRSN]|uniref:CDP-glycerol glycerophosphotransferase family protein n=1 Tax=Staphylococcus sp. ACRSN TaxID=2918214 RepID=UPI001EF311CF|nr:CDP-glycerol glycerophosphotransferase family protein [Staphylococcus sp. ACRSN]MCG7338500.1 CDP-glycerol glycerophosphotransferase family protein [Staphylococcus sp. ACRSN]